MRAFTSFVRSTTAVVQILWCCPKWRRTPKKGADGSGSLAQRPSNDKLAAQLLGCFKLNNCKACLDMEEVEK